MSDHLRHVADLVLAWYWANPARTPAGQGGHDGTEDPPFSHGVCLALAELHHALAVTAATPHDLRDLVEVLFQCVENDGYTWITFPSGGPFDPALKQHFNTFGLSSPAQPVSMRREALLRDGRLILKGELRAL